MRLFKKQHGCELDPEEFGCQGIEDVLKRLTSKKKCLLAGLQMMISSELTRDGSLSLLCVGGSGGTMEHD